MACHSPSKTSKVSGELADTNNGEKNLTKDQRDEIRLAIASNTTLDDVDINCYEYFGKEVPIEGDHGYFTTVGTQIHYLPWNYWLYAEDNVVLEVKGVPASWTAKVFMEWWNKKFTSFGTAIMTPTVTDLNTKMSWRWLIFRTEAEKLQTMRVFGQVDGVRLPELARGSPTGGRLSVLDSSFGINGNNDSVLVYYIHHACDEWYKEKYTALVRGMMVKNSTNALSKEDVAQMSLAELLVNQEKIPLALLKELAELNHEAKDAQDLHGNGNSKGKESMVYGTLGSSMEPDSRGKDKEKEAMAAGTKVAGSGVPMMGGFQYQNTAKTGAPPSPKPQLSSIGHHQSLSNTSTLVPQQPDFHTFAPGQPIMGPNSQPQFSTRTSLQEYLRHFNGPYINYSQNAFSLAANQHTQRADYVSKLEYRNYLSKMEAQGQSSTQGQSSIQGQSSTQTHSSIRATSQLANQLSSLNLDQNGQCQCNAKKDEEVHRVTESSCESREQQGVTPGAHQRNVSSKVLPEISPYLRDEPVFSSFQQPAIAATNPAPTWADVLGQPSSPSHSRIDIAPERHRAKPSTAPRRLVSVGRIPEVEDIRSIRESSEETEESQDEQMRVVFLLNLPQTITVTNISDAIKEGPICSIRFGHDDDEDTRYAGVIFQYANHASAFIQVLLKEKAASTPGRFKFCADVALGDPFPLTDTLRQMGPPEYASRRLTLVKKAFFFINGERQLRTMCENLVGAENIQKIFLYNGGNATIIFAEVQAAIKMKRAFEDKVWKERDWEGLQIDYSKDPCEVALRFITEMSSSSWNIQS
ncbi:hypothetical protein BP5796_06871 [Coleophoma crateriformis]|uniref:RRM domain-containing protein n=1 Tax=Coleophoma crateriformis TaxID=565419 RepID=A0A3D8RQ04_9HELO|nr:hypothetical protein BP5796_06871 [Coleophoma crateriformis]